MKQKIALLIACMLMLSALAGCTTGEKKTAVEPVATAIPAWTGKDVFGTITGLDPEKTVMSAEGVSIPLALYCYWQVYNASLMEYRVYTYAEDHPEFKSVMGTDGYLNWEAPFGDSDTLRAYLNRQTDETARLYMAVEAVAAENGLTLDENDQKTLEAERQELVKSLGGEEAFTDYIAQMGLSRVNYDRISAYSLWLDKLAALAATEGSSLYIGVEDLNEYGLFTDHIYLSKVDLSSYKELSKEAVAAKKQKAEELARQIAAAQDPESAFAALADEVSEDPYRADNPEGYIFAPGTMNAVYEGAAQALTPGQVSAVVEGETGFYIILRKDLKKRLNDDAEQLSSLRDECLMDRLVAHSKAMDVTVAPELEKLDVVTIYPAFVKLMRGQN